MLVELLAYLLLADGQAIRAADLERRLDRTLAAPCRLSRVLSVLLRRDVPIETVYPRSRRRGYRLAGPLPDDLLEIVLERVHRIRARYERGDPARVEAWLAHADDGAGRS